MDYLQLVVKMVENQMLSKNNETGIICDGNSLDEIYSSIDLILKNNSYKNFINKTKEFARKFEWDNIIKQYFKIL